MHSPLLALDEDEFGGSTRVTAAAAAATVATSVAGAARSAWSDMKHSPAQVPGGVSDIWESADDDEDAEDEQYAAPTQSARNFSSGYQERQHQYQHQQRHLQQYQRQQQSPRVHENGAAASAAFQPTPDDFESDTQLIHPPHRDWQHSGNLQGFQSNGTIEKLSQDVGRLSFQLQELVAQVQSLRSSVTVTGLASPARVNEPGEDPTLTHDLNDQLLRTTVQERLVEKLKQLLSDQEGQL